MKPNYVYTDTDECEEFIRCEDCRKVINEPTEELIGAYYIRGRMCKLCAAQRRRDEVAQKTLQVLTQLLTLLQEKQS